MKVCRKCKIAKPLSEFHKNAKGRDCHVLIVTRWHKCIITIGATPSNTGLM